MGIVAVLLDKCRTSGLVQSDNQIAEHLGVSRQVVSGWRHGSKFPSDERIVQLARIAGIEAGPYLVGVHAEHAGGAAGRAWAALARRLGTAAVLALAVLPQPSASAPDLSAQSIHYANKLAWWLRMLFRLPAAA